MLRPLPLTTFAIGSLPHAQTGPALLAHQRLDIPTLPQLPSRDPAEHMLPQALEGLPGLSFDEGGHARLDVRAWERGARELDQRLWPALTYGRGLDAFEPSAAATRAWRPFLWDLSQHGAPFAKVQLTGPLTATWATLLDDDAPLAAHADASAQAGRLILARALAMVHAVRATGATPILFLDEPGLIALNRRAINHAFALQELGIFLQALKAAGALVGIHSCSETDWEALLRLPFDFVSVDAALSFESLLRAGTGFDAFLMGGGSLALGIVPTSAERPSTKELVARTLETMGRRQASILARTVLTPACGLALCSVLEAERVLSDLVDVRRQLATRADTSKQSG